VPHLFMLAPLSSCPATPVRQGRLGVRLDQLARPARPAQLVFRVRPGSPARRPPRQGRLGSPGAPGLPVRRVTPARLATPARQVRSVLLSLGRPAPAPAHSAHRASLVSVTSSSTGLRSPSIILVSPQCSRKLT